MMFCTYNSSQQCGFQEMESDQSSRHRLSGAVCARLTSLGYRGPRTEGSSPSRGLLCGSNVQQQRWLWTQNLDWRHRTGSTKKHCELGSRCLRCMAAFSRRYLPTSCREASGAARVLTQHAFCLLAYAKVIKSSFAPLRRGREIRHDEMALHGCQLKPLPSRYATPPSRLRVPH